MLLELVRPLLADEGILRRGLKNTWVALGMRLRLTLLINKCVVTDELARLDAQVSFLSIELDTEVADESARFRPKIYLIRHSPHKLLAYFC